MVEILNAAPQVSASMTDAAVFKGFAAAQDAVMHPVERINTYHLFQTKPSAPTKIAMSTYNECPDNERVIVSILKRRVNENEWYDRFVSKLQSLQPPGIQTIKWIELHDKWKPLVPRQYWSQFHLYSEDPGPERRQQVKKQLKESKQHRQKRVRTDSTA